MTNRKAFMSALIALLALASGCRDADNGPLVISAIGDPPRFLNPNLSPLDPPSSLLLQSAAQGLVRFDAAGQVEPALAERWIVSDDGLRYTFRIGRTSWSDGSPVTAEQVAARLRAAASNASRNRLKPLLGAIDSIEAMTDNVLEITLKAPRPNFLQLLAQPDLAILRKDRGTGPYRAERQPDQSVLLTLPKREDDEEVSVEELDQAIILRGEPPALAVARFARGQADLVTGGTIGSLPIARAAEPPANALRMDPVGGLFGLEFSKRSGPAAEPALRRALSMAIDRAALVSALGVAGLEPRLTLLPSGMEELPGPTAPDWAALPLDERRRLAAAAISGLEEEMPLTLRVAVPEGPGYRLVFAHLRRDWRSIGVNAERVKNDAEADLALIDAVAPAHLASWYLRRFTCKASRVCSPEADQLLEQARQAQSSPERKALLAGAERLMSDTSAYIPLTAPVRWSLVSPRLTGFKSNPFGRRFIGGMVAGGS